MLCLDASSCARPWPTRGGQDGGSGEGGKGGKGERGKGAGRNGVSSALADKGGALADKGAGASGPDGGYIDVEQGRMRRMHRCEQTRKATNSHACKYDVLKASGFSRAWEEPRERDQVHVRHGVASLSPKVPSEHWLDWKKGRRVGHNGVGAVVWRNVCHGPPATKGVECTMRGMSTCGNARRRL